MRLKDSAVLFRHPIQRFSLEGCKGKSLDWGVWRTSLKTSHIRAVTLDSESYASSIAITEKWSSTRSALVKYCQGKGINLVFPKKYRRTG
ncbi:hypothetical protein BT69DRAFT_516910 [Atractiella rhizophila]|nr:hypothetical protein BT69DRAFT_516910 [Atractiella rhizophila]